MTNLEEVELKGSIGSDRRFGPWLFAISSLTAMIMRMAYLFQVRDATLFKAPLLDSAIYVARAWEMLHGDIIGKSVSFHSAPLYPYFIAAVMGIVGSEQGLWWLRIIQALLSALTVGLLSWTALRLFGRWAGAATAVLSIFYAPFLFYSGEILEITLTMLFLAWAFWLMSAGEKLSGRRLFAVGALLGLAALGKPNLLILGPVIWISLGLFRPLGRPSAWAWSKGLLLAAGILVAILPFTFRNRLVGDDWVLISSNGGINLFIGNNPQATGGFQVPSSIATDLDNGSRLIAEEALGRRLKPSEVSRFWSDRTLAYFGSSPGHAAVLMLRKAALLLNHYEIPNHYNFYFFREYYAPILSWTFVGYSMLLPLGLLGLAFGLRRDRRTRRHAAALLGVALTVVLFFVTSRYRLPVVILLFPFAGYGLALLGRTLQQRRWKLFAAAMLILMAGTVLVRLPLVTKTDFHQPFMTLSNFWFSQQDYQLAAFYSTEALRQNPDSAPAWQNLGYAYLEQGDFRRAEDCLWKAVSKDPNLGYAYGNLSKLYFDYTRPILAEKCLDKAEALAPVLKPQLAEIRKMMPVLGSNWVERSERLLRDLSEKEIESPGAPNILAERAQILGLRLERHAEALAVLDSIPQAALEADSTLASYVGFIRERLLTIYENMHFLD
jgi:tetratricopeptide (TPR) repeat protein